MLNIFKHFKLDDNSIKIYQTILSMRDVPSSLVANKLDIPRSTVQFKCKEMVRMGLLSVFEKNNVNYFSPENPERISTLLKEEKINLDVLENDLQKYLPALLSVYNKHGDSPSFKYFEGVEGIKVMFKDVLASKSPLYGMTRNEGYLNKEILRWLEEFYIPERIKNKNSAYIIFNENKSTREYIKRDKILNRVSLFIPEKDFLFSSCCHIYDGKVAFYSYDNTDMTGIIIENKHIFLTMLSLFKLAWMGARGLSINEKYKEFDLPY